MHSVDFFIVGQPKSGTTALASFLDEHPEISISIPKETGYMSTDHAKESDAFHGGPRYFHIRTPEQYEAAFAHAKPGQLLGDASTNYLYSKAAAQEIAKNNPEAKIIIMLRNPVDMVYSLYNQYRNETKEHLETFEEALKHEKDRKKGRKLSAQAVTPSYFLYKERGLYHGQIKRYQEIFNKNQLRFIITEEFRKDNAACYQDVLKFLGVKDSSFRPEFKSVHESKAPRSKLANIFFNAYSLKKIALKLLGQRGYTWIQRKVMAPLLFKSAPRQSLDPALRKELEDFYRPDVAALSKDIGIDLVKLWGFGPK